MTVSAEDVRERELAIVLIDLARFTQVVAGLELQELASIVVEFYRAASEAISQHGGRVIKFVGDGCLAVFEPEDVLKGLAVVEMLRGHVPGDRSRAQPRHGPGGQRAHLDGRRGPLRSPRH